MIPYPKTSTHLQSGSDLFSENFNPALIYIYLRLCNLYFTYLQSRSGLFSQNFNRSYIFISNSAICTSRIYSLALFLKLHLRDLSFNILKLQPALTCGHISISVSAICTSRIYSLAVISFLKTSTCAHIYLSPSLQSVLHVFTVSQWSLFLKLQPALIYIYIYLRLCNLYFTYLQFGSDLFSRIKTSTCAHIYLSPVFLCNLYFTYLQSGSDLFS